MAELYSSLGVTPRKKRHTVEDSDDEKVLTPKRIRTSAPLTPPTTASRHRTSKAVSSVAKSSALPPHLARLLSIQRSLHHALAHALATSALSPSSETGIVPNVLNHLVLAAGGSGLKMNCSLEDLQRLCWLWEWEWDLKEVVKGAKGNGKGKGRAYNRPGFESEEDDEDAFFLDKPKPEILKNWTRGGMGLVIGPTTCVSKTAGGKRVPAYGLGVEVEMDIDKGMRGGMAAVARWTADGEKRMALLNKKLGKWVELHADEDVDEDAEDGDGIPPIPLADLPPLVAPAVKQSALTQRLASLSPKSPKSMTATAGTVLQAPPSPSRSISPSKLRTPSTKRFQDFAIPFPITPVSARHKPQQSTLRSETPTSTLITPRRPRLSAVAKDIATASSSPARPETPTHQRGKDAETAPETPSTSRRAALYERIRKKSESTVPATPSRTRTASVISARSGMTRDQLFKLSQDEIRRRCLLGRLSGVAESVWMLFTSPQGSASISPSPRKRRTLPTSEVVQAIIKSSPVPISAAEAHESINMLTSMCPFFLKSMNVGSEDWLEMPASGLGSRTEGDSGNRDVPPSPSKKAVLKGRGLMDDADELRSLSPKRVKKDWSGGLREVRERIKRELDADAD